MCPGSCRRAHIFFKVIFQKLCLQFTSAHFKEKSTTVCRPSATQSDQISPGRAGTCGLLSLKAPHHLSIRVLLCYFAGTRLATAAPRRSPDATSNPSQHTDHMWLHGGRNVRCVVYILRSEQQHLHRRTPGLRRQQNTPDECGFMLLQHGRRQETTYQPSRAKRFTTCRAPTAYPSPIYIYIYVYIFFQWTFIFS